MKKIIFCLPGKEYSGIFLQCWTNLMSYCYSKRYQVLLSQTYDPNIYYVRNKLLGLDNLKGRDQKPFDGRIGYDYIFFIDSDIIFNTEQVEQLLTVDLDVVSGLYKLEGGQNYCAVENWDIDFFKKNGYFKFLTEDDIKDKDILKVTYTGLGFCCIKYGVLEKLKYPIFEPVYTDISENVRDFASEDASLFLKFKKLDINCYVNCKVKVGHLKSYIY